MTRSVIAGLMLWSALAGAQTKDRGFFAPPSPAARLKLKVVRLEAPLSIDGVLDEPLYAGPPGASGFTQVEPEQGAPATHDTQVWVGYDDRALYVGARLAQPGNGGVFNQRDMRRDFELDTCDSFSVVLDPFGDGRNALGFQVNPWGAQRDVQVVDDRLTELNWDTVWSAATRRDDGGWTVELAIPWKSVRHGGPEVAWGIQLFRRERGRNEDTTWSPFPRNASPFRMTYAGVLQGLELPPARSLSLQLRPYVIARGERVGDGAPGVLPTAGGEVTWNPVGSTQVDLTLNTDFAETDVDHRVVNLSRFSPFFPERRQFFLESSGLFTAGEPGLLMPFFSRTIGLADGEPVPISAGLRTVYRSEDSSAGAIVVHTLPKGETPAAAFGVARYQRNLGEESRAGGLLVVRHDFDDGGGITNVVPVADGLWRNGAVTVAGTLMGSVTAGPSLPSPTIGQAATVQANLRGNWGGLYVGALDATRDFDARAGFVARGDIAAVTFGGGLDYRPKWLPPALRNMGPFLESYVVWGASDGQFEEASAYFSPMWVQFSGGDELWMLAEVSEQVLSEDFEPVPGVSFAPGHYSNQRLGFSGFTQASRRVAVGGEVSLGEYYGARELRLSARGSVQPLPHLQLDASWSMNRFWGPGVVGDAAVTHLVLVETRLALNPKLQLIGSWQRDTAGNASVLNARLAWEFQPLSFLYVVFTDTRPAFPGAGTDPPEQRLVAKLTYTWRP